MDTLSKTKGNYNNYFKDLDNYYNVKIDEEEPKCCDNHNIVIDNTYLSCTNCGETKIDNINYVTPKKYLNQRFHNCTIISSNVIKFKSIRRLHHFSNYSYKEVVMIKSFKEMNELCEKMKLSKKIFEGSKIKYKEIFLDLKISSRSNIKRGVYLYCIMFSCNYYNVDINIDELIKISNIEKKHYNKVLKKLEKKNVILSHSNINKFINICKKNNLKIDKKIIIKKYQDFKKKEKIKLNNNSILIGILFELLNIPENQFIKIFKTTKITLSKFNKTKCIQHKEKKIKEYLDFGIFTEEQAKRSLESINHQL